MGILQGQDCTVCSLKWIKHDGSAGTEAVPVEVGGEAAYFQKANYTPPHRDYMCLRVAEGQLVGRGGCCIDHKWRAGRCTQQARGRNGSLILNLGGARTLRFRAAEDFGTTTSGMLLDVPLVDRSVVVFGAGVNAITEHEVLPGGLGKRLSLVYQN